MLLVLALVLSWAPATVQAASASGTLSTGLTWTWENNTLTISGSGYIPGNYDSTTQPWEGYYVEKLVIEDGVTSIGYDAFEGLTNLKTVTIAASVN